MEKICFDSSVSVISYNKDNVNYGMSCAWGMQVDYSKMMMLLGSQSDTGNNIKKGDIIGVSVLNKKQKDIALHFGKEHSKTFNKFDNIDYIKEDSTLFIKGASRIIKAKVIDVLHLEGIESDNLLYLDVISNIKNDDDFLTYQGFLKNE